MPLLPAKPEPRDARAPRDRAVLAALAASVVFVAFATTACASPPRPPPSAGPAGELRADAPTPACVTPIVAPTVAPSAGARGDAPLSRGLREDELWETVFPSFHAWSLPPDAETCTGIRIATRAAAGASAVSVREGSTVFGGGADRMRVAWLPVGAAGEGARATGALALYRSHGPVAEVLGIAPLDAVRARTKLSVERLGADVIVVVTDVGCAKGAKSACETRATLFAPRRGRLVQLATYLLEQRLSVAGGEPGVVGPVDYHLQATARFEKRAIRISEQLDVTDEHGVLVRKIQQERGYAPEGDALIAEGAPLRVGPIAK